MRQETKDAFEIAIIVAVLWASGGSTWWWYVVLPLCGILMALKALNLILALATRIVEKVIDRRDRSGAAESADEDRE